MHTHSPHMVVCHFIHIILFCFARPCEAAFFTPIFSEIKLHLNVEATIAFCEPVGTVFFWTACVCGFM